MQTTVFLTVSLTVFLDKYQLRSAYSNYETKNCKDLQIPRLITEQIKKGFYYNDFRTWSESQLIVEKAKRLGASKELKSHLTS